MLFKYASIQRKLALLVLSASLFAVVLACVGFGVYERASFRAAVAGELSILADTLGANTAASLAFDDQKSAQDMLAALRAEGHILGACLYDNRGKVFAEYRRPGLSLDFKIPEWHQDGPEFESQSLTFFKSVTLNQDKMGSIAIVSDLSGFGAKIREYVKIAMLVLLVSILATYVFSSRFLRVITEPMLQLAEVAARVSLEEDYTLRALPRRHDEVGKVIQSFNHMLERIQERDTALQAAKDQLEIRVEERTEDLRKEIGERRQAEVEMRLAKDVAERASRTKGEFLANMSHEIRTPLNGIVGMTDLALDTELTREQREYLETVKISADSLLTVINDVLDFSKIEAGRIDLEMLDFNLRDCLEMTLKTLALRADEKGLELLCEVAPDVPEVVQGDSNRLRQIVTNLVGNAIKFTERGEVAVSAGIESLGGAGSLLRLTVSDTGIGIPLEKQKMIFDPFSQADTSTTRKYGGTGLGLTISARLAAMMGGRIWLESEVGTGTQFHFTVLFKASADRLETGGITPPEIPPNARVLVVDDNATSLRILGRMLDRWGLNSMPVESGEEALAELTAARNAGRPYALVLADSLMPKMDGFKLVEGIRERPELSAATIMMLSSTGHRAGVERAKSLGVAASLLKPIRRAQLRDTIGRVLGVPGGQRGAISSVAACLPQDTFAAPVAMRVLVAEDNPINQRVVTRLLEKRGHHVAIAANGLQALHAMERDRYDVVLMDVQMPEMDGIEATRAIREGEKLTGKHQVVIALTAHAMKGDENRCRAVGMDGYLTKPIQPRELNDLLDSLFQPAVAKNDSFR